jgi:hypothetical protein
MRVLYMAMHTRLVMISSLCRLSLCLSFCGFLGGGCTSKLLVSLYINIVPPLYLDREVYRHVLAIDLSVSEKSCEAFFLNGGSRINLECFSKNIL